MYSEVSVWKLSTLFIGRMNLTLNMHGIKVHFQLAPAAPHCRQITKLHGKIMENMDHFPYHILAKAFIIDISKALEEPMLIWGKGYLKTGQQWSLPLCFCDLHYLHQVSRGTGNTTNPNSVRASLLNRRISEQTSVPVPRPSPPVLRPQLHFIRYCGLLFSQDQCQIPKPASQFKVLWLKRKALLLVPGKTK